MDSKLQKNRFLNNTHANVNNISVHTWHNRLGHLSDQCLHTLKRSLHFDTSKAHAHTPCYICPLAKQKRLPFVSNNHMALHSFDLVHCDIWGPLRTDSYGGYRYFLTLVDDSTRFTWVYLLRHKSDATHIIPRFFNMIVNQFQVSIKIIRSDNAKELALTDFLQQKGIIHQLSCVERPQQNSVVERKHQHLLNVARALYFQACVPISFWTDCILTVVFLINRTPSILLLNKSPFEKLYKTVVDYDRFRVFGCLAFASTLSQSRKKFEPRVRTCVFLGYPPGMKAYKLIDITTKQVFFSRDVIFHEDVFPFQSTPGDMFTCDPFPNMVIPYSSIDIDLPHSNNAPTPLSPVSIPDHNNSSPPRRTTRVSRIPSYLREYHCNLMVNKPPTSVAPYKCLYPLSKYVSYDALGSKFKAFTLSVTANFEP